MSTMTKPFKPLALFALFWIWACSQAPEQSENISTKTFNYPVLKGKRNNPVLRITVDSEDHGRLVKCIALNFLDTDPSNIDGVNIFYTAEDSAFSEEVQFGAKMNAQKKLEFTDSQVLKRGKNYFWISCTLAENADLKSFISSSLEYVQLDETKRSPAIMKGEEKLRTGVAVRQHRQDNVHTYRIPGLATTRDGTLLAIYDVRREGGRDLQGHMDIGVSRSTDGGNNWEPMRIALDMGEWGGLPEKYNGISDANILVDRNTGDIYIAGLWMHGVIDANGVWQENLREESKDWNHQWRTKGSQPGFGVKQTSQFLLTKSTDDGLTWSKPVNLTQMCKKEEWWLWAPAPGHGITLDDGTLVIPSQGRDETGLPFSNITYSKDGGKTWHTSNPACKNTTECMAVQLSDGSLMLNMRDNRNRLEKGNNNGRAIATTKDLGRTWAEHETSHDALIECVCMACIHKHVFTNKGGEQKSVLFFSNPNSKYARHKQTIKVSFDDGKTWPEKYWIELDEGRGSGYSCLTSIDENTLGILYEGSQAHMTFQAIDVSEIFKKVF